MHYVLGWVKVREQLNVKKGKKMPHEIQNEMDLQLWYK